MFHYRPLLILHIVIWTSYGVIEHISHTMYGQNHWLGSSVGAISGMLLTLALALMFERTRQTQPILRWTALVSLFLVVASVWHSVSRVMHAQISWNEIVTNGLLDALRGSSYSVSLLIAWSGLYLGALYFIGIKEKELELAKALTKAREAQLQSLRYQLNPHFLFNVLNSIDVAVLDKETDTAHEMIEKLSRLLRSTLENDFSDKILLSSELTILQDFIDIEQQRFKQKITVDFQTEIDPALFFVPPMILQPLMENALKFTWEHPEHKVIRIKIHSKEGYLHISITNPKRHSPEQPKGMGVGLQNVRDRLEMIYSDDAFLGVEESEDFYCVMLTIPEEVSLAD